MLCHAILVLRSIGSKSPHSPPKYPLWHDGAGRGSRQGKIHTFTNIAHRASATYCFASKRVLQERANLLEGRKDPGRMQTLSFSSKFEIA